MSFRDKNRRDTSAADQDETAAAAPPAAPSATPSVDHTELLRRSRDLITYVWGSDPPFKDLADLLADLTAALDGNRKQS